MAGHLGDRYRLDDRDRVRRRSRLRSCRDVEFGEILFLERCRRGRRGRGGGRDGGGWLQGDILIQEGLSLRIPGLRGRDGLIELRLVSSPPARCTTFSSWVEAR